MSKIKISLPEESSVTILSVNTASNGTTWTAFGDTPCTRLDIVNNTGAMISYRRNGTGPTIELPDGASRLVLGITNANQIQVRRADSVATQVAVKAEAFR